MSHVDDGELTAYADGAYPADDPVALRIAAHLSTCGNCRTRVEQSHELRDRAAEILAFATPATLAAPSFETLQAQATTLSRKPRSTIPLAWAASIILAIGLGWFGRDALRQSATTRSELAVQETEPLSVETRGQDAPAASAPAGPPVTGQTSAARKQERPRDMAANRAVEEGKTTGVVADAATPEPAPAPQVAAAPPPPPPSVEVSELALRRELTQISVTGVATEYITAAEAERRGIHLLRIPDLPIARVGLQAGTTIVEQTLPDETVVTLTVANAQAGAGSAMPTTSKMREAGAAARAPAPQLAAAAQTNVVVKIGNKSVTITGDLQPDSLRALGRKVR